MSTETRKVLEMLAEGKISTADAERLLEKLAATPRRRQAMRKANRPGRRKRRRRNFCACMMERPAATMLTCALPLTFVRSGVKLAGILPPESAGEACARKASIPNSSPSKAPRSSTNFTSTWRRCQANAFASSAIIEKQIPYGPSSWKNGKADSWRPKPVREAI